MGSIRLWSLRYASWASGPSLPRGSLFAAKDSAWLLQLAGLLRAEGQARLDGNAQQAAEAAKKVDRALDRVIDDRARKIGQLAVRRWRDTGHVNPRPGPEREERPDPMISGDAGQASDQQRRDDERALNEWLARDSERDPGLRAVVMVMGYRPSRGQPADGRAGLGEGDGQEPGLSGLADEDVDWGQWPGPGLAAGLGEGDGPGPGFPGLEGDDWELWPDFAGPDDGPGGPGLGVGDGPGPGFPGLEGDDWELWTGFAGLDDGPGGPGLGEGDGPGPGFPGLGGDDVGWGEWTGFAGLDAGPGGPGLGVGEGYDPAGAGGLSGLAGDGDAGEQQAGGDGTGGVPALRGSAAPGSPRRRISWNGGFAGGSS